jgi:DNA-directed RNA polymerase subunit M/transcription elongation factor TFIIS
MIGALNAGGRCISMPSRQSGMSGVDGWNAKSVVCMYPPIRSAGTQRYRRVRRLNQHSQRMRGYRMKEVRLTDSDRTMFATCPECNKTGLGLKAPRYFSMAYSRKQWRRKPVCDNCGAKMVLRYEVEVE